MLKSCLILLGVCFFHAGTTQSFSQLESQYADSSETIQLNFFLRHGKSNFLSNRPLALQSANKALSIAQNKSSYLLELADTYNLLGIITMYDEKYEEAAKFLDKSLALSTENNFKPIKLKALGNIALNYMRKGEYQKGLQANFALLPLLEGDNYKLNRANCLANMANAYNYLGRLDESNLYQLDALKLFKDVSYNQGIANAYNTLGNNYTIQKNYSKAKEFLQKSAELKTTLGDKEGVANSYINLALLHNSTKNYSESFRYLKKAEGLFTLLDNKKGLIKTYTNMGVYFSKTNDYENAKQMELKALDLSTTVKDEVVNTELYRNMSMSYAKLNDLSKAYDYSKKALDSKDSLVNLAVQKQISDMQVKYETAKKEKLLKQQELELAQKQLAITKRNYIIAGGVGFLFLSCLIFYLGYRRYHWKQEARLQSTILKQQELATKAVLEAEETERQRIAKDLHDGVGQMMSAAKMNLSAYESATMFASIEEKLNFEKIIQLVDESCTEVRAVSHNMMPNALLKNSLAAAIREFISKLDNRQLAAHLYTEGLDERLDSNIETILYRVVQECVNNVIKHSGASTLDISIIKEPKEITVTVEDNGKGFDVGDKQKNCGIGLKNIRTRVEYLKGTVDFDSAPQRGTLVALHVPL